MPSAAGEASIKRREIGPVPDVHADSLQAGEQFGLLPFPPFQFIRAHGLPSNQRRNRARVELIRPASLDSVKYPVLVSGRVSVGRLDCGPGRGDGVERRRRNLPVAAKFDRRELTFLKSTCVLSRA